MTNLPIQSGLSAFDPLDRRTSRELASVRSAGALLESRERAKLDAIAGVTESALIASSHISAMEALLIAQTPHAEGRLRFIADAGCAGLANVVLGMGRSCR